MVWPIWKNGGILFSGEKLAMSTACCCNPYYGGTYGDDCPCLGLCCRYPDAPVSGFTGTSNDPDYGVYTWRQDGPSYFAPVEPGGAKNCGTIYVPIVTNEKWTDSTPHADQDADGYVRQIATIDQCAYNAGTDPDTGLTVYKIENDVQWPGSWFHRRFQLTAYVFAIRDLTSCGGWRDGTSTGGDPAYYYHSASYFMDAIDC